MVYFFYFEILLAPSELPANLPGQFSLSGQLFLHWAAATLKRLWINQTWIVSNVQETYFTHCFWKIVKTNIVAIFIVETICSTNYMYVHSMCKQLHFWWLTFSQWGISKFVLFQITNDGGFRVVKRCDETKNIHLEVNQQAKFQ